MRFARRAAVVKPGKAALREETLGGTSLMDALDGAIHHSANIHKYARTENVPEHTIFVITTDGMENAIQRYSADEIREMITKEQTVYGWEFLFLAANIDVAETAESYGIQREYAAPYYPCPQGISTMYECLSDAVAGIHSDKPLKENWSNKCNEGVKRDTLTDQVKKCYCQII